MRSLAAGWLLALVLHDAVPGSRSPRAVRWLALTGPSALLVVLAEYLAHAGSSTGASPGSVLAGMVHCYPRELAIAIPATLALAWLLSRAYPLHPVFVSSCGGLGVGFLADAALHLTCPATDLEHTLVAHGGAVATLAVLSGAIGYIAGRRP